MHAETPQLTSQEGPNGNNAADTTRILSLQVRILERVPQQRTTRYVNTIKQPDEVGSVEFKFIRTAEISKNRGLWT
jgi:hypothetical protein